MKAVERRRELHRACQVYQLIEVYREALIQFAPVVASTRQAGVSEGRWVNQRSFAVRMARQVVTPPTQSPPHLPANRAIQTADDRSFSHPHGLRLNNHGLPVCTH